MPEARVQNGGIQNTGCIVRAATAADPDGCVVRTAPLSRMVAQYVARERRDRPSIKGGGRRGPATGIEPVGPYEYLSAATGIPEDRLRGIRREQRRTTELRDAEALVAAIGEPGMFYDGTLTIEPNPAAPPERRAECCGGSLNGAAARPSEQAA